ncbi:MAG: uracil-DNA glycosylase, partial [Chloroflexota bacterium]|nr:uracil-DNA glycosylase [Chloroflexota bacterium]
MENDSKTLRVSKTRRVSNWNHLNTEIVACRKCPRLVEYRERIAREKRRAYRDWDYWGRPVPGFGDHNARIVLVGLAPGAHGSNRTGRMFTGDASGEFLYAALQRAGFANQSTARHAYDGLKLRDVFITAICRCAPPDNKPTLQEQANCLPYLAREFELLKRARVVVALGRIGLDGYLRLLRGQGHALPRPEFRHGAVYRLENLAKVHPERTLSERSESKWESKEPSQGSLPKLICSYHPSKQNTQTGRLTAAML